MPATTTDFSPATAAGSSPNKSRLWQLEALRGCAAFYLLLHHVSSSYLKLKHTLWGFPFRFGQEGVLLFFLLSGFVICYANGRQIGQAHGFRNYLIKRGRRIYPIFLLSLLGAYAIQCVMTHHLLAVDFTSLAGNLCMLQDHPDKPGVFILPFADNMPLWSLSYEWWFYMLFYPICRFVPVRRQKYLVLGICGLGLAANQFIPNSFFNFLTFFLIWWAGVELAREFVETGDVTLRRQFRMLTLLALPALWYAGLLWQWRAAGKKIEFIGFPFVEFRYFFVAIVVVLLTFAWKRRHFFGYQQTIGRFHRLGAISYALYVFHYPIVYDLRLFPGNDAPVIFYADLCLRVGLSFVLAWLAEGWLQKWINARTDPWLRVPPKPQPA